MEKKKGEPIKSRFITYSAVVVLNTAAFSCSFTAEFNKVKVRLKYSSSLHL
jgi:hypothetical protein